MFWQIVAWVLVLIAVACLLDSTIGDLWRRWRR